MWIVSFERNLDWSDANVIRLLPWQHGVCVCACMMCMLYSWSVNSCFFQEETVSMETVTPLRVNHRILNMRVRKL